MTNKPRRKRDYVKGIILVIAFLVLCLGSWRGKTFAYSEHFFTDIANSAQIPTENNCPKAPENITVPAAIIPFTTYPSPVTKPEFPSELQKPEPKDPADEPEALPTKPSEPAERPEEEQTPTDTTVGENEAETPTTDITTPIKPSEEDADKTVPEEPTEEPTTLPEITEENKEKSDEFTDNEDVCERPNQIETPADPNEIPTTDIPPAADPAPQPECLHVNTALSVTEASCTRNGVKTTYCEDCGMILREIIIESVQHTYSEYKLTVNPTETSNGKETAECIYCHHQISREYVCLHRETQKETKDPTVDQEGYISIRCVLCNKEMERTVITKLKKVNLSDYTPIAPFAHLDEKNRNICEEITRYISHGYDKKEYPYKGIPVLTKLTLSWDEIKLIESSMQIYYGDFTSTFNMLIFSMSNTATNGVYSVNIYIDTDIAVKLEKQRRENATNIDDFLSTLVVGDKQYLAEQIFDYLDKNTKYSRDYDKASDIFKKGKGSCNAFAIVFRQACLRLGIECDMIVGYTKNGSYHAWNQIKTESGNYLYYDLPCWKSNLTDNYRSGIKALHKPVQYNRYEP